MDTNTLNVPELYGVADMAKAIGVSDRTVMRYIVTGTLKCYKVGGKWKITKENLERYLRGEEQQ